MYEKLIGNEYVELKKFPETNEALNQLTTMGFIECNHELYTAPKKVPFIF